MEPTRIDNSPAPMHRLRPTRAVAVSQSFSRWALGSGLLALHATLFFTVTTSAIFWNLMNAPADLWAVDLLRRWGALVVFHAVAVAAGMAAFRLLKIPQPVMVDLPEQPPAPSPARTPTVIRAGRPPVRRR